MALSGRLDEINLASVFQNLAQNGSTGTLAIEDGPRRWPVFLEKGRIAAIVPGKDWPEWLGGCLKFKTRLTDRRWQKLKGEAVKVNIVDLLRKKKAVPQRAIDEALTFLQHEALYDLFQLQTGAFSFESGPRSREKFPPPFHNVNLGLNPDSLLMEAARRTDELGAMGAALGSLKGVYVLRPEHANDQGLFEDPNQAHILRLMDGSRDVDRVCRDSGLGRFYTCTVVSHLLSRNYVTPVRAEDHVRLGAEAYNKGRISGTTFHYRRALELRRTDNHTRCKLADILAEAGQVEEAVTQYKLLATMHLEDGERESAAEAYKSAIKLVPRDVSVRERLFELWSASPNKEAARQAGEGLAKLLGELGLQERAQSVYKKLLQLDPDDPVPIVKAVAECSVNMGDLPAALKHYRRAVDEALSSDKDAIAARLLEEILKIDGDNDLAHTQLEEIKSGLRERKKKHWALVRRIFAWFLVFMVFCGWVAYDNFARHQYQRVTSFCYDDVGRGDVDLAIKRLKEFQDRYPYCIASMNAHSQEASLRELAKRLLIKNRKR